MTNKVVATIDATSNRYAPESAAWIAADDATVWVPEAPSSELQRVDANSNHLVARIPVGRFPKALRPTAIGPGRRITTAGQSRRSTLTRTRWPRPFRRV